MGPAAVTALTGPAFLSGQGEKCWPAKLPLVCNGCSASVQLCCPDHLTSPHIGGKGQSSLGGISVLLLKEDWDGL